MFICRGNKEALIPNVFRIRHKNGTERILEGVGNNLLDNPLVAGFVMNIRDITESKRAEEKEKETAHQLKTLFEANPTGILLINAQNRVITSTNPMALHLMGYSKEEVIGQSCHEFVCPAERYSCPILDKGQSVDCSERMLIAKNNKQVPILKTVVKVNINGEPHLLESFIDITDHKLAEETLRFSFAKRQEMEFIVTHSPAVVWLWKAAPEWPVEYVSDNLTFYYGYTPDDFTSGRISYASIVHPDDFARVGAEIEQYTHEGRAEFTQEYRIIAKSGDIHWIDDRTWVRRGHDGSVTHYQGIVIDITGRKKAEDALRQSEEQLRLVMDNMVDLVLQMDTQAVFQYFTPSVTRLFGYRIEELLGKCAFDFVHPADREDTINAFQEAIQTGHAMVETRLQHNDGHYVCMEIIGKAFYTEKGDTKGLLIGGRDITVRKRMQEALISLSQRLNDIIDFLPDATLVIDKEGKVITWNRAIESMTGVKAEEMLGRGNYEYALPFYGERMPILIDYALHPDLEKEKAYTTMQRTGDVIIGEAYTPILAPGNVHLSGTASVLRDSKSEIIGAIECLRNNTDRKEMEERLQRAEKMESLGVLAGGVAHDLNNVLGVLVGYSELLLREVWAGSRVGKYAKSILQGAERAAAIIQDLLTMARRGVSVSETVNLNRITTDFLNTREFEIVKLQHPDILFRSQLKTDLLNIKGSPIHLFKAIMNLLSNAAESISGAGEVTIMTENRYVDVLLPSYENTQEGEYVVLTVSDTGSGISPADLGRIFEPFYTKKVMGRSGTGLGLAVVWGTVKDHGGYIDVHSEQNKGSTFTLYFPATREALSKEDQNLSADLHYGRGESILIVDDVEAQRLLAATILENMNYRVSTAASGNDALEYLMGNKADIVVLDMIMEPGIDGLETYRRILEIHPQQKAVIVSGFAKTDRVEAAQKLGAGEYIKKPYVISKLSMAVRKELDRE